MPDFEFEFNQTDKDLVINQQDSTFIGDTNYMRLTIYPAEAGDRVVQLTDNSKGVDGRAIFFSSLIDTSYNINISPFSDFVGTPIITKDVALDADFTIYRNENEDQVYIKPNEIFNEFGLPQGDYRIQVDFLFQEKITTPFIIKQISTSRKEVRIKILDK